MKVTARNWQMEDSRSVYQSAASREAEEKAAVSKTTAEEDIRSTSTEAAGQSADSIGSGKAKASVPDDSVGQLAAELARAESRIDVQQVQSKATRALTNLKMSAYACEGDDAKKVAQMIKRMEKLIKRIQKKLKQLNKEEQLENKKTQAEKKQQEQKAEEIRKELRSRRNKRRREERDYALKEMGEDSKLALNDVLSGISASTGTSTASSPDLSALSAAGYGMDAAAVMGVSVDITV